MSQEERDKREWLKRAQDGKISQREAAGKMGVSDRWVRTLLERMKKSGDAVVVHGLRGRTSNRRLSVPTRQQAMTILRQPDWHDFGPTFAAQELAKHHQIQVGKETLRGWMIEDGRWKPDAPQSAEVHVWRPRRSGFGELVPWDTSEHDWLEGRGPVRYLVRLIDDATSWSGGRFVKSDSTPFNMAVRWEYLEQHGRMVDVYTDRASMFKVSPRPGETREQQRAAGRLTQMGRVWRELGIGSILALSPQAKGRVERSFHTAQDRLVKQLRLAKVSSLAEANAFLEKEYWPEWNEYFARPVQDFPNHHRPVTEAQDLAAILSHVEDRVIANDFTFSFAAQRYLIPRDQAQAAMRRQPLRVELRLNGGLQARYQGRYLNIVAWPRAHRGPCVARVGRSSTGPQRSQRRRQKRLDAGLLRPAHAPLWKLIQD